MSQKDFFDGLLNFDLRPITRIKMIEITKDILYKISFPDDAHNYLN